jgi:hypothetical protein
MTYFEKHYSGIAWRGCEISVRTVDVQAMISFWYLLYMDQGC